MFLESGRLYFLGQAIFNFWNRLSSFFWLGRLHFWVRSTSFFWLGCLHFLVKSSSFFGLGCLNFFGKVVLFVLFSSKGGEAKSYFMT